MKTPEHIITDPTQDPENVGSGFSFQPAGNALEGIVKLKPEITFNTNRTYKNNTKAPDGIEIRFGATRPTEDVRTLLKKHGFQFSERQTLWYALDNALSRELVDYLQDNEVEADDARYEKRYMWAAVKSYAFYEKLTNYTEFMIGGEPPRFYRSKTRLEAGVAVKEIIRQGALRFKKFFNVLVDENGNDLPSEESPDTQKQHHTPDSTPGTSGAEIADKLDDLAKAMQKTIDGKFNSGMSKQRPTARRMRIIASMREDGYVLQNIQKALYALASGHRNGSIHDAPFLKHIRTKSQIELLNKYADRLGRKHEDHYLQSVFDRHKSEFAKLGIGSVYQWSLAFGQKEALIEGSGSSEKYQYSEQKQKIEELELKIKSRKIEGFFPTPPELIAELIRLANIKSGQRILEPSAGKGDILDALREQFNDSVKLAACELDYQLRELLTLKGYTIAGTNFLEHQGQYERILMNPPFEKGQDIDHVLHAFSLLTPNGRLVAIMGEGAFSRSFQKERQFRNQLFEWNAFVSPVYKNAFKNAFNQTGVAVRIVVLNKDGSHPDVDVRDENDEAYDENHESDENEDHTTSQQPDSQSDAENDLNLLELEALAELELLQMEVELKKKKNGTIDGLNGLTALWDYPDVWNFH